MKEITLVRCSSHSKSSDDRFTAKAFLDGILIRKPRQDGVLVSVISIFRLYVESDGMCSLWETKTYRETRYSRWSLGDSPCGIMQFFFLSLFLSCLSGSACRRWVAIRLVSHRTKTNVSQQAAKELKVNMLDVRKYLISVHLSCVSRIEHWQERVFSYLPRCCDACTC